MPQTISRVFLIVLDSVGIGELPDAARYGDEGSSTLGNLKMPALSVDCVTRQASAAWPKSLAST